MNPVRRIAPLAAALVLLVPLACGSSSRPRADTAYPAVIVTDPTGITGITMPAGDLLEFRIPSTGRHHPDGTPAKWGSPTAQDSGILAGASTGSCPSSDTCATFRASRTGSTTVEVGGPSGIVCSGQGQTSCVAIMAIMLRIPVTVTSAGAPRVDRTPASAGASSTTSTSTTPPTTSPPTTPGGAPPPFSATVTTVTAADLPYTWRPGCPVPPADLRMLHMTYWGFDSQAHIGTMVVSASVADEVIGIFRTLYADRFPIFEMVPEDAYHGDDNAAAAADDTSGFNCRDAVAPGPPQWSVHAFGEAIDVNDVQNPYVDGSTIIPPSGAGYLNRSDVRPGMAVPGGVLVEAFAAAGWPWGGRWSPGTDYQHFSKTGG